MYQQVNKSIFIDAFRSIRPDNFSYKGLSHLYDYLEELEAELDQMIELDVIAICCDYSEYGSAKEVIDAYGLELEDPEDLEELEELLSDNTNVVCCEDDCIIIQEY